MNSETPRVHHNKTGSVSFTDNVSFSGFNLNLFITSVAAHVQGDLCDLFVYFQCFCGCWRFTSSVPVAGGPLVSILSHSQKSISDLQDNTVNEVPWESGAVSNRFNPVSGLEPDSPAAPGGPVGVFVLMATAFIISDAWPLNCDHRGSLAALDVMSSSLLGLGLVR